MKDLTKEAAVELCNAIRIEKVSRWYSWFFSDCWNCTALAEGDPKRMTLGSEPGYSGCAAVNARYEEKMRLN